MLTPLLSLTLQSKRDVVLARQSARQLAKLLGFGTREQMRIAAAVFEVAYNACRSLGRVTLNFELTDASLRVFPATIARTKAVRNKTSRKKDAPPDPVTHWDNAGILRLADHLRRHPTRRTNGGLLQLDFPLRDAVPAVSLSDLPWIVHQLTRMTPPDLFEEIRQQNDELLRNLDTPAAHPRDTAA
jgi:hypothetical protein